MKVYVNNPGENWIVDRIRAEWYREKPDISTENIQEADVVWIAAPWMWQHLDLNLLQTKKVLCTIHHIVPSKFNEQKANEFLYRDQFVNAYHVPNRHTADFISRFTVKPIHIVGYWFDSKLWKPMDKEYARRNIGIEESKFVIGSFQRDTEGSDLKSPKLEKGPDLFCDYVEKIANENTLVLLGGWRRQYIINRLNQAGIQYKYIEMAPIEQLREMYACCDLYIVSSRVEGGPQALLEAPAMKTPIVSTRMGSAEFLLNENCIIDMPNETYLPTEQDVEENFNIVQNFDIIKHVNNYEKLLRSLG